MKRGIILAIGLILLTIPLFACLPSKPATPIVEYESKSAHNDDIASVKNSINNLDQNKANDSSLRSLRDEVNSRLSNVSGANAYSKSETYTKAEVDQKIKAAIDALKADQSWVNKSSGGSSGGGGSGTTEGSVVASNGQLTVTLDRAIDDVIYLPDDSWSDYFRLTVKNTGGSTYYRLNVDFDTDSDIQFATYPILSFTVDNNADAYMFCSTANARTDNAAGTAWTTTTSTLSFTSKNSSGVNKLWIGKDKTESVFLRLYCNYNGTGSVREWSWNISVKEISL